MAHLKIRIKDAEKKIKKTPANYKIKPYVQIQIYTVHHLK